MPYTRNTRIKTTKFKHKQTSVAEVEYKYPLIGITKWVEFEYSDGNTLSWMLTGDNIAFKAYKNALWADNYESRKGFEWAQAIIDEYHKLLDEEEWVPEIKYIKYPEKGETNAILKKDVL